MIQAGHKLKMNFFKDWREQLIINWSENEKNIVKKVLQDKNNYQKLKIA